MKLAITPRSILVGLGLLLLALFILIGGPYIAFADFRPLETLTAPTMFRARRACLFHLR